MSNLDELRNELAALEQERARLEHEIESVKRRGEVASTKLTRAQRRAERGQGAGWGPWRVRSVAFVVTLAISMLLSAIIYDAVSEPASVAVPPLTGLGSMVDGQTQSATASLGAPCRMVLQGAPGGCRVALTCLSWSLQDVHPCFERVVERSGGEGTIYRDHYLRVDGPGEEEAAFHLRYDEQSGRVSLSSGGEQMALVVIHALSTASRASTLAAGRPPP